MRALRLILTTCVLVWPAQAKYSGGRGTAADPHQIATAADLIALGETPADYDKHFILTADIDLNPNLSGRKVFDKAVIAPDIRADRWGFDGTPFTGLFDGKGHTISHLTMTGGSDLGLFGRLARGAMVTGTGVTDVNITGSGHYVGGLAGCNARGRIECCYSTGTVRGTSKVGGLVGSTWEPALISMCYSTAAVRGEQDVGGLVGSMDSVGMGYRGGLLINCYSTGPVTGASSVGVLVGSCFFPTDPGFCPDCPFPVCVQVTHCCSTGTVNGASPSRGLVGSGCVLVNSSFWDIGTSGPVRRNGDIGLPTSAMQDVNTYLDVGWDLLGETENGTEDIWSISEGPGYPRLWWQDSPEALAADPRNGTLDAVQPVILRWQPGGPALQYDIYFGNNAEAAASASTETLGTYRGRQPAGANTYDPGVLEWGKTYYWRIDEVNEASQGSLRKGTVWSFTTADSALISIVDDFESYAGDVWEIWIDGWTNGTGSCVGNPDETAVETAITHGGWQSLPFAYSNRSEPWYSEAESAYPPYNWRAHGADTLTLYFRGRAGNEASPLYVAAEDRMGRVAVATHPDPNAVLAPMWQKWHIPLTDLEGTGVEITAVMKIYVGVGNRDSPQPGGTGLIYIDDIGLTKQMP